MRQTVGLQPLFERLGQAIVDTLGKVAVGEWIEGANQVIERHRGLLGAHARDEGIDVGDVVVVRVGRGTGEEPGYQGGDAWRPKASSRLASMNTGFARS